MFDKIKTWASSNPILAILAALATAMLFFPRLLRAAKRRRVRRAYRPAAPVKRRRRVLRMKPAAPRRRRSKRAYSKNGKKLKPWQIKGSRAARLHMAKLRRMR